MSEILSLEQIEDEIGMLVRGGGDADRVLTQFMALSAALAAAESRLSRATTALRGAEASLAEREALLHECNAVCLCGCPESEHESYGEDGESCGHDDHECLRVPKSVLAYVETLRRTPARDEVREAAEALLEDYDGVEDQLPRETADKVLHLRSALSRGAKGGE